MTIIDRADLFCKSGSKDAVYHLQIVEVDGGFVVNYQNGRAGGTLASGSKSPKGPGTMELARKTFDKVVKEKMTASPPYLQSSTEGSAFTQVSAEMLERSTGLVPQLLNDIDEEDTALVERYINDPTQVAEQKYDGHRRMVRKAPLEAVAIGSNRRGLEVPLPVEISDSFDNAPACTLDAEIIDNHLHVFDIVELRGRDLRSFPLRERKALLDDLAPTFGAYITVAQDAVTPAEKRALIERTRELGQEGVVFKDLNAPYTEGRPNSGGPQVKLKHWKGATVICIAAKDDKRSVRIGLLDDVGGRAGIIEVGACTIPPNVVMPMSNSLFDVKYLYAFDGGSLFQPTFDKVRTDLERDAACISQLKFKKPHIEVPIDGMDGAPAAVERERSRA